MGLPRRSSFFYTQLLRTYVRLVRDAAPVKCSAFTAAGHSSQLLLQLLWGGAPGRIDAMRQVRIQMEARKCTNRATFYTIRINNSYKFPLFSYKLALPFCTTSARKVFLLYTPAPATALKFPFSETRGYVYHARPHCLLR